MDIPPSPDGFPPLNRTDSYVVHVSRLGWQLKGHLQIILAIDGHQPVAQPVAQRIFETSSKLSKSENSNKFGRRLVKSSLRVSKKWQRPHHLVHLCRGKLVVSQGKLPTHRQSQGFIYATLNPKKLYSPEPEPNQTEKQMKMKLFHMLFSQK